MTPVKFAGHKYTWQKPFTSIRHQWELRGPVGAVDFHASLTPQYPPSCGLEFHYSPRWSGFEARWGGTAPQHLNCPVLGGPCWHEGTSLYASEALWPMIEGYLKCSEHEQIFRILECEYCQHFERGEE